MENTQPIASSGNLKPKSGFPKFLLIGVVVVLLVFGVEGYYFLKIRKEKANLSPEFTFTKKRTPEEISPPPTTMEFPVAVEKIEEKESFEKITYYSSAEEYVQNYPLVNFAGFNLGGLNGDSNQIYLYGTLQELNSTQSIGLLSLGLSGRVLEKATDLTQEEIITAEEGKRAEFVLHNETKISDGYTGNYKTWQDVLNGDEELVNVVLGAYVEVLVKVESNKTMSAEKITLSAIQ